MPTSAGRVGRTSLALPITDRYAVGGVGRQDGIGRIPKSLCGVTLGLPQQESIVP